ncbi:MAG TPA: ATP-dependent RecD-like DNA helicase [Candidatus Hydrogenedentes bacterium]|nr:ATP-dependent RecD-like DNA helicase [Candidatus Hydrogenedentota bacterium]
MKEPIRSHDAPSLPGTERSPATDAHTLTGILDRRVYESEETGFMVARLRPEGGGDPVIVVGDLASAQPGETLKLTGYWEEHPRFGRQFRAETFEVLVPTSEEGLREYLGSGLFSGIGREYAARIVRAFGRDALRVIEETPERLREVPGIGPKRARQISESYQAQRNRRGELLFLFRLGIGQALARRLLARYGGAVARVIQENPYRLAREVEGIGYLTADRIATKLGMAPGAPQRLRGALLYALQLAAEDGHLFLPAGELVAAAAKISGQSEDQARAALGQGVAEGEVVAEGEACYLPELRDAEVECAEGLVRLLETPKAMFPIDADNALRWMERATGTTYSPEQREALKLGLTAPALIITGGPGTGKTTILKGLLSALERKGISFLLASPTGRAARRMEEATGYPARTVHRLLEYSPAKQAFTRDASNPLVTEVLVIDEASMLDILLFRALLRALPASARLILVGDTDQLPSVGPGNVLADLLRSGRVPTIRLRAVFRQAEESGIIRAAHQINQGHVPTFNSTDCVLIEREDPEEALETVIEVVARRLPRRFGWDPIRDIQVLSPVRRGPCGVDRLNEALGRALRSVAAVPAVSLGGFSPGDKVMQTRNDYTRDVCNGDIGVIRTVDPKTGELEVAFDDGRVVLYDQDSLDQLTPAWCATVHKSQGSEYPVVVLTLLTQHYMMLQRNVLYTALTRAERMVIVVGSRKAVIRAVRSATAIQRNTLLADRLRGQMNVTGSGVAARFRVSPEKNTGSAGGEV